MRYYKLIDPFDISVYLYLPHRDKNGKIKSEPITMRPGKKYAEFADDDLFISELLECTKEIPYTKERKTALDKYGARYTEKKCGVCGGRVKKLVVHFAEVVEV